MKAFNIFKQTEKGNLAIEKYDLKDILFNGDRLCFDLVSEEIWTNNILTVKTFQNEIKIEIDLNIPYNLTLREYLLMLIKTSVYYWTTFTDENKNNKENRLNL